MPHILDTEALTPELVPGLRTALRDAQLATYIAQAEAWCHEEGAAYLYEIRDDLEEMSASLGLAEQQRQRLSAALERHLRDEAGDEIISTQRPVEHKQVEHTSVQDLHQLLSNGSGVESCVNTLRITRTW